MLTIGLCLLAFAFVQAQDEEKYVIADFELEENGTQGFVDTGWADGLAMLEFYWAEDPTGESNGVVETIWDFTEGAKDQLVKDPIDLQWSDSDTGVTAITIDVFVPYGFPTNCQIGFWAQDKGAWNWMEFYYSIDRENIVEDDWNTITFDVLEAMVNYPTFDPKTGFKGGVQFYIDGSDWAGEVWFDNITLVGISPPAGALSAPTGVTVEAGDSQGVGGLNHVAWQDVPDPMAETYQLYASQSPIEDLNADGVIKVGTDIPRGLQAWNHPIYSADGSEQTWYYAVTAKGLSNGQLMETTTGFETAGPFVNTSRVAAHVPFISDFAFELDGDISEFVASGAGEIIPWTAAGLTAESWDPASTDLNFSAYFVASADYLYIGAEVTDDDPFGTGDAWDTDSFEVFAGLYDAGDLDMLHSKGSVADGLSGDWRMSFTAAGLLTQGGAAEWETNGITYNIDQNPTGYVVEASVNLRSMSGTETGRWNPSHGDMFPIKIDLNDEDVARGEGRSLQNHWGDVSGNQETWLRPSWWGYGYVSDATGVAEETDFLPLSTLLHPVYPNPFNPSTTLSYDLGRRSDVQLRIVDVLGRVTRTLVQSNQSAGSYTLHWDGKDDLGLDVSAGVFFLQLETADYRHVNKLLLVK